ncbi:MAG TPA: hypothetical protein VNK52_08205 [Hyphomicrobiaceae bacterium]|nr:hypothetical protein [Hyphomicrobiaceae bacterium]
MREETRRRLDRAILFDRLKRIATVVLAIAAIVAGFVLVDLDAAVEDRRVSGTVEHVGILNSKDAARALAVDVKLEDGRHVTVIALKTRDPHVGDHVTVSEHRHRSGRVTYTWR